jgi:hypothetical protein
MQDQLTIDAPKDLVAPRRNITAEAINDFLISDKSNFLMNPATFTLYQVLRTLISNYNKNRLCEDVME